MLLLNEAKAYFLSHRRQSFAQPRLEYVLACGAELLGDWGSTALTR